MTVSTAAAGLPRRSPGWPHRRFAGAALVAAASVAGLATLTACEQPTPGVTVFSGTHSANREAICWSREAGQAVTSSDCSLELGSSDADADLDRQLLDQVAVIPTAAGATVGISVDPVVAESGWLVTINGRALTRKTITGKYFRFTMPPGPLRRGDAQLVIQAVTSGGDAIRGAWLFGLTDAE